MRVNREIRVPRVRVIDQNGNQVGVLPTHQALTLAEEEGLDLVEIAPNVDPPVCKIVDYGKFRYQQTKKEKESKKAQHQVKVKEVKLKPNTDEHDLLTKARKAREFLGEGDKVRVTCVFRGREMQHREFGQKVIDLFCEELADVSSVEEPAKMMGRFLSTVLAPGAKAKKKAPPTGKPNGHPVDTAPPKEEGGTL